MNKEISKIFNEIADLLDIKGQQEKGVIYKIGVIKVENIEEAVEEVKKALRKLK